MLGCGEQADLATAKEYSKDGLSFSIPGNWRVEEDAVNANGTRYVLVEVPDAVIAVNIYSSERPMPFREYVEEMVESSSKMKIGSRTRGTVSEVTGSFGGRVLQGYKNEFVVSIAGVGTPHEVEFYSFSSGKQIAYVSSAVAREDLPRIRKGFELMLSTFSIR